MYIYTLKRQHIHIYIYLRNTELTDNGNFCLFAASGKRKRKTSVCFLHIEYKYVLPFQTEKGKRKPRRFSLFRLPFAHRVNGSLSFVRLFTKKQTEAIRLQTD
jgi:hypothetical protein